MLARVYAAVGTEAIDPLKDKGFNDLASVFGFILNVVIGVGWSLVVIMLAMGFVQYIISQGEKLKVEQAQKWLTFAVVGGVGLFFVMVLKRVILNITGGSISINNITI